MKANEIRIAEPCGVDWKAMTPAEGGRFCGDCKKVVRNLSSMTEREAKKLLRSASDGQLCVRYIYDKEGKIWFGKDAPKADPLLPAGMLSRAKRVAALASMAIATQACDAISAATADSPSPPEDHSHMMGGVGIDPDDIQVPPPVDASTSDASVSDNADAAPDAAAPDASADGGTQIY